jgi:hypothetical protein
MTTHDAPTERVTCSIPGPRNDRGRPKLVATLVPDGLKVWCGHCKAIHLIPREKCIEFWSRGESVQCRGGQRGAGVE